jgi:hypothetical protein
LEDSVRKRLVVILQCRFAFLIKSERGPEGTRTPCLTSPWTGSPPSPPPIIEAIQGSRRRTCLEGTRAPASSQRHKKKLRAPKERLAFGFGDLDTIRGLPRAERSRRLRGPNWCAIADEGVALAAGAASDRFLGRQVRRAERSNERIQVLKAVEKDRKIESISGQGGDAVCNTD